MMRKAKGIFVRCALLVSPGGPTFATGTREKAPLIKGVISRGSVFTTTAVKKPGADGAEKRFVVEYYYDKSIGRIGMRRTNTPVDDRYVVLTWSPLRQISPKIGPPIGDTYVDVLNHTVAGWDVAYKRLWLARLWEVGRGDPFQTIDRFDCYRLADYQRGKLLQGADGSAAGTSEFGTFFTAESPLQMVRDSLITVAEFGVRLHFCYVPTSEDSTRLFVLTNVRRGAYKRGPESANLRTLVFTYKGMLAKEKEPPLWLGVYHYQGKWSAKNKQWGRACGRRKKS